MDQGQWVAQAYQIGQAGLSHSVGCDVPRMAATMDLLLHSPQWALLAVAEPQWALLAVAEPAQALALLEEYGY